MNKHYSILFYLIYKSDISSILKWNAIDVEDWKVLSFLFHFSIWRYFSNNETLNNTYMVSETETWAFIKNISFEFCFTYFIFMCCRIYSIFFSYIYIYIYIYICVCVCVCVCTYIYMYVYIFIYMYAHTYMSSSLPSCADTKKFLVFCQPSLLSLAPSRFSRQHPVSAQSWYL